MYDLLSAKIDVEDLKTHVFFRCHVPQKLVAWWSDAMAQSSLWFLWFFYVAICVGSRKTRSLENSYEFLLAKICFYRSFLGEFLCLAFPMFFFDVSRVSCLFSRLATEPAVGSVGRPLHCQVFGGAGVKNLGIKWISGLGPLYGDRWWCPPKGDVNVGW